MRRLLLLPPFLFLLCMASGCAEGKIPVTSTCGDAQITADETCDDGNTSDGDGCSSSCIQEEGWVCNSVGFGSCLNICGDGLIRGREVCDSQEFGGATCESLGLGEGTLSCDRTCQRVVTGCKEPMLEPNRCGDGRIADAETCDDQNVNSGDGCSNKCTLEPGWVCTGEPSSCSSKCGNGQIDDGEVCDGDMLGEYNCEAIGFDGGTLACSSMCGLDDSGCTSAACGDGRVDANEQCDDNNAKNGDGCSLTCRLENGFDCSGEPSVCVSKCGNGAIDFGEECDTNQFMGKTCSDFGGTSGMLSCRSDCTVNVAGCVLPACNDGNLDVGEECDGANLNSQTCVSIGQGFIGGNLSCNTTTCRFDTAACVQPRCGDGIISAGETCDDANIMGGDGCSATCTVESNYACTGQPSVCTQLCGNGQVDAAEQCEAGMLNGGTCQNQGYAGGTLGCVNATCQYDTSACLAEICGNGTREGSEACDGTDFGGTSCAAYNFTGGMLSCGASCMIDTSGCNNNCQAQGCANDVSPDGERCSRAKTIGRVEASTTETLFGDTTGDGDNDDLSSSSSSCWDAKYDNFYKIYLLAGESINVRLNPGPSTFNSMLKIYQGTSCASVSSSLVSCYNTGSDGRDDIANFTATTGGWYTIVVDGRSAFSDQRDYGSYSLSVTLSCGQAGCCCM